MHTAVIDIDGDLYSWGKADSGQTGYPFWYKDFLPGVLTPKKVHGFEGRAIDIACGGFHTLILTSDHVVYAMGKEDFGLLGTGNTAENMSIGAETPTIIPSFVGKKITGFSAGGVAYMSGFMFHRGFNAAHTSLE
jgi:alpha-tubulin suppressor-like RCC1 family protein